MPKVDVLLKMLFESDDAVADVFNAVFGGGRRLITPSMVRPATGHEIALREQDDGEWKAKERICDVVRCIQWDATRPDGFFLFGIENQLRPHLLMPWRVMETHDLSYGRQEREAHRLFDGRKARDRVEFLSAVPRDFRFRQMVTVVIYWGEEPWDVPRQFTELLAPTPFPELLPFVSRQEYPLLIPSEIPPKIIDGMEKFLKMVLKYVCASRDRSQLLALLKENPEYQELPREFAQGLLELLGCLYKVDEKKERVDMCKAIRDMVEEGEKRGKKAERTAMARDFVQFMRENSFPEDKLHAFLAKKKFSPKQIAELCAVN